MTGRAGAARPFLWQAKAAGDATSAGFDGGCVCFLWQRGERMQTGEKHYNISFPHLAAVAFSAGMAVCAACKLFDRLGRAAPDDAAAADRGCARKGPDSGVAGMARGAWCRFCGDACHVSAQLLGTDPSTTFGRWMMDNIVNAVSYNPFQTGAAFGYATACLLLSAGLIYLGNSRWGLKKAIAQAKERKTAAAALAVFTAPYLFICRRSGFFDARTARSLRFLEEYMFTNLCGYDKMTRGHTACPVSRLSSGFLALRLMQIRPYEAKEETQWIPPKSLKSSRSSNGTTETPARRRFRLPCLRAHQPPQRASFHAQKRLSQPPRPAADGRTAPQPCLTTSNQRISSATAP